MHCFFIGNFEQPYKTENYITYGFEQSGVQVTRWQENQQIDPLAFAEQIASRRPDFVLVCKNRVPADGTALIERLKQLGIKTVCWLFDLYFDLPPTVETQRSTTESQFRCHYVFTTDGGHAEKWRELAINHAVLRQGIHEPEAVLGTPFACDVEIAFIGTDYYRERHELIQFLKTTYGRRFRHYGRGGVEPEVRGLALNVLLASLKVVVGDSMPWPSYWSNRIYEILGRGGFLLHPRVEGLDQEFAYYKHLVPFEYGNLGQVKELVDFYLTHDSERERIRRQGFHFVSNYYTYTKRCRDLLWRIAGETMVRLPKV